MKSYYREDGGPGFNGVDDPLPDRQDGFSPLPQQDESL